MALRITNVKGMTPESLEERDLAQGPVEAGPFAETLQKMLHGVRQGAMGPLQGLGPDAGLVLEDASLNSPFDLMGLATSAPELIGALTANPAGLLPALGGIEERGGVARDALLGEDNTLSQLRVEANEARDRMGLAKSLPLDLMAPDIMDALPLLGALGMVKAFHGSPHRFSKFDLEKIGSGQGAQTFGHGLYFAENPNVSKSYVSDFVNQEASNTPIKNFRIKGQRPIVRNEEFVDYSPRDSSIAEEIHGTFTEDLLIDEFALREANAASGAEGVRQVALRKAQDSLVRAVDEYPEAVPEWKRIVKRLEQEGSLEFELPEPSKATHYETRINVEPEDLLDWDKPLSEQSPKVREALAEAMGGGGLSEEFLQQSGASYYQQLAARLGNRNASIGGALDDAAASAALREAGIPGLRYLDQGSRRGARITMRGGSESVDLAALNENGQEAFSSLLREHGDVAGPITSQEFAAARTGASEGVADYLDRWRRSGDLTVDPGTRNLVMFDDSLIEITSINGEPVSQAGQAAARAKLMEQQQGTLGNASTLSRQQNALTEDEMGRLLRETNPKPVEAGQRAVNLSREELGSVVLFHASHGAPAANPSGKKLGFFLADTKEGAERASLAGGTFPDMGISRGAPDTVTEFRLSPEAVVFGKQNPASMGPIRLPESLTETEWLDLRRQVGETTFSKSETVNREAREIALEVLDTSYIDGDDGVTLLKAQVPMEHRGGKFVPVEITGFGRSGRGFVPDFEGFEGAAAEGTRPEALRALGFDAAFVNDEAGQSLVVLTNRALKRGK